MHKRPTSSPDRAVTSSNRNRSQIFWSMNNDSTRKGGINIDHGRHREIRSSGGLVVDPVAVKFSTGKTCMMFSEQRRFIGLIWILFV